MIKAPCVLWTHKGRTLSESTHRLKIESDFWADAASHSALHEGQFQAKCNKGCGKTSPQPDKHEGRDTIWRLTDAAKQP